MKAEVEGGQFSRRLCEREHTGVLKSIVFFEKETICKDKALQNGLQIQLGDKGERSEAQLSSVPINEETEREIHRIHELCEEFIDHHGGM
jgi:hypothetical protein